MIPSMDVLAGAKYPELVAKIPRNMGIGLFWDTFGSAKSLIESEARAGRIYIRVQGQWSDTHSFSIRNERKALEIGKELQHIAVNNRGTLIEYSPYCEHKLPASFMTPLLHMIRINCPNIVLVNTPISGGQWVNGFKNEIHHGDKPAGMPQHWDFNFSMDGLHALDANTEMWKAKYANAGAIFMWCLQFNLKRNHKDKTPREKRKCKPTPDLINAVIHLFNPKENVNLSKGWLYKAFAEQHTDVDPRANKPVVLTPKGKRVSKVTVGSTTLRSSGSTDGRQVWRCDKWGYKMGRTAEVKADGKVVGTVDQGFRQNEYRDKGE